MNLVMNVTLVHPLDAHEVMNIIGNSLPPLHSIHPSIPTAVATVGDNDIICVLQ
jgi:hypothetical protein